MAEPPHSSELIRTKFYKPDLAGHTITRLRLNAKLDLAYQKKLTLVSAPAGYGKTTAVLQWLGSRQAQPAWISLDENDNAPKVFWQYICSALNELDESILPDTAYVFSSPELFKTNFHLHILLDKLEAMNTDAFLVLDDFHHITNPEILKSLLFFLRYIPSRMHLILIGRAEPVMELAQIEVQEQLSRITANDLRFERQEVLQFYTVRGFSLDVSALDVIGNYAEGWAAALVMIAISLNAKQDQLQVLDCLRRGGQSLGQYFLQEVYGCWPDEKQAFFLQTSILDAFCAQLCDAVTQSGSSGPLLTELKQGNGFLISLDENAVWYRYHHLFRDFLRNRLSELSYPASALHGRAASWFYANGQPQQAVEHYLAGMQYQQALALIAEQSPLIINSGDCSTALSLIARIPESILRGSLEIAALKATFHAQSGQFALCKQWIAVMETIAAGPRYASEEAKAYAEKSCRLILAHCLILEGDMAGAYSLLKEMADSGGPTWNMVKYMDFNPYDITFFRCSSRSLIHLYKKQPAMYQSMLGSYRAMLKNEPPGYDQLIAGESLYESNCLEEAKRHLLSAVDKAARANCPGVLVPGMAALAKINRAQGDIQSAFTTIASCEEQLQNIHKMHWNYLLKAFRVRMLLASGDLQGTESWFQSCKLGIYQELSRTREYELLVFARCLIAREALQDADMLLNRLLTFALETERRHSAVEALNLLAMVSGRKGEEEKANQYLERSIAIGVAEGYLRSFLDEGEPLARLISRFPAAGKKQKQFIHAFLAQAFRGPQPPETEKKGPSVPLYKQLTRQEQKVLALLADGYTNREISGRLEISLSTTKIHLGNIFGKLQVTTRIQCVNEARRLGVLP